MKTTAFGEKRSFGIATRGIIPINCTKNPLERRPWINTAGKKKTPIWPKPSIFSVKTKVFNENSDFIANATVFSVKRARVGGILPCLGGELAGVASRRRSSTHTLLEVYTHPPLGGLLPQTQPAVTPCNVTRGILIGCYTATPQMLHSYSEDPTQPLYGSYTATPKILHSYSMDATWLFQRSYTATPRHCTVMPQRKGLVCTWWRSCEHARRCNRPPRDATHQILYCYSDVQPRCHGAGQSACCGRGCIS